MKRKFSLVLILALSLPTLAGCGRSEQDAPMAFDGLAPLVPGDADQAFFLDFEPGGEAGRHWEHIRAQLEADPTGEEALRGLTYQFRVEEYGLDEVIVGPAVSGYWKGAEYVVMELNDEEAARDVLLGHFEGVTWEQDEFEGKTIYHRRNPDSYQERERLAWTIFDRLLFLASRHDHEPLGQLQSLVSLTEEDSLAAFPSWRTLRKRLPARPMGLVFFNVSEQARRNPPALGDTSPGAVLVQQIEAIALAAMPETDGMRVEVVGSFARKADDVPELRPLFDLPAVDAAAWPGLPADTAIALFAHDASVVWPLLKDLFILDVDSLDLLRDTIGLDLEADLLSAEGPLTGDLALGISPPLPDQPISQGLTAAQLLILARGATEAQADAVRAAMESRGAVFGPREVEGVALQTQVGTEPTGYAISYGFDGDTFLFGSSSDIIGQGVAARREGQGLVATKAFRAVLATLPDEPTLVVYLNSRPLTDLMRANMTEREYQNQEENLLWRTFGAIGLGLRLQPDQLDGVLDFLLADWKEGG